MPTKQSEITYRIGKYIESIVADYPQMNTEGKKFILAALLNVDFDIIDAILESQIDLLIDNHAFFENIKLSKFPSLLKINDKVYKFRDFDLPMNVETYAEMDQCALDNQEEELFKLLYLPIKKKLKHYLLYNYKSIQEMNYYAIKLPLMYYYKWKKDLMNEYNLNYDNENIPADQKDLGEIQLKDIEKFGLYHILLSITNDDYDKMQLWLRRDIKELFKFLLYIRLKSFTEKSQ